MAANTEVPAQRRAPERRGPIFTTLKVAWWMLAIGVTGPILIGVLRRVFAS